MAIKSSVHHEGGIAILQPPIMRLFDDPPAVIIIIRNQADVTL